MPYLFESNEWRLLHELGRLLDQRKARYHVQAELLSDCPRVELDAELIEVELRCVLMVKENPRNLDVEEFQKCQTKLKSLCSLLDELAWSHGTHGYGGSEGPTYPHLRALTQFIPSTSGALDLVSGPNKKLFKLPPEVSKLYHYRQVVTECSDILGQVLRLPPEEPIIQPVQKQKKNKSWKKALIRNRAMSILETLFDNFKCGMPHKVLLKLIQDPDGDLALPNLHLMLSPCPELELWQEARYDSINLDETISLIPDICTVLQQNIGQGKGLMLLVEGCKLFGAWSLPASFGLGLLSTESLDQLIWKGVFKPLSPSTVQEAASARMSTKDRRALAVKLGFCLMNFFDANFTSKGIYFLNCSRPDPKREFPYFAFSSKLPVTTDLYDFRMGHPTLLSFAKLLLEIEFGENIDLDISPNISKNRSVWFDLLTKVERLEDERGDSYLKAIKGCLVVHSNIRNALGPDYFEQGDTTAADSIIREELYKEIVHKLEQGLDDSIPRSAAKRQRSESPPPSSPLARAQIVGSHKRGRRGQLARIDTLQEKKYDQYADDTSSHEPSLPVKGSMIASSLRPSRRDEFEIAFICALPLEYNAVSYVFDEFYDEIEDPYGRAAGDPNTYTTGRVGKYNVVLALLPHMGKVNAAGAAASMRSSYSSLRLALLIGVCGGIPHDGDRDILLGDVVISKTVLQYDFGRRYSDKCICRNTVDDNLGRPNKDIGSLVRLFETDRGLDHIQRRTGYFLEKLQANAAERGRRSRYNYPGAAQDKLFESTYRHKHHVSPECICRDCFKDSDPVCDMAPKLSCADLECDNQHLIVRERLQENQELERKWSNATPPPVVHVGTIASGDMVMKSAADRDRLARELGVIAFEMEGAGVWDEVPCIVVKGVCDYADSHKHKGWQNFAAATAASAAKAILERYITTDKL